MTPEQITQELHDWLMRASRIAPLPMGTRPCTWAELSVRDPETAGKWRLGVALFLDTIGAREVGDGDEHLNFIGEVVPDPQPAPDSEPGEEPPNVRPDD
jgi:hypothetical protein